MRPILTYGALTLTSPNSQPGPNASVAICSTVGTFSYFVTALEIADSASLRWALTAMKNRHHSATAF